MNILINDRRKNIMNLWTENEEDLREETKEGSKTVNKSGVYNCTIEEALIISGKNGSQSQGLKLVLKTDEEQYFYPVEFFRKADGTENEYARKKLNKLTYLCKLKNKDLVPIESPNKVFIPALADKKIGVIVEVSLNGDFLRYNIIGYYDIQSKKTADEIQNKKNPEIYERFKKKFENVTPVERPNNYQSEEKTEEKNEELPEEFPF
jgi:hypothetical protein